ncbi:MAG: aminopeptidase N [Gammaproteobacteria bacterium]|nr:aminopeptidase N [Gammaproteobacteria bacterium]
MVKESTPKTIYLKEYTPPKYWIDNVDLHFGLSEDETQVVSQLVVRRNESVAGDNDLVLNGEQLRMGDIFIDDQKLDTSAYLIDDETLTIRNLPAQCVLKIETFIKPQENTSLEGLYKSSGNYCTQCEAEGFRKITYYLDRPDVMAKFTTTIVADKEKYPVLLSNGNPVDSGELDEGRHFVTWEDPFKKPCYLFALVAGKLECITDTFKTMSGRDVDCRIYVEKHNLDKCDHAMLSLKKSMLWDEQKFGREYDLDIYMIVAVDDFNMGAMENKGLNVFNSKYVLAKPDTATDMDFINIEAVIGHEYFHNWSGNRVTCRDWFQLTLKEGLTVFRDQQFTADMNAATVKRIDDVNVLRTRQFAEDAGPMSHPIQPDSYVEINNFYTVTVYNKGAEIIRMIHTLLGEAGFRKGMDLYFDRHDGEAATTEDFIGAMEDANDRELKQFRRWYHQAGTPDLNVTGQYDSAEKKYTLFVKQSSSIESNKPFYIPLSVALINDKGIEVPGTACLLNMIEAEQQFVFENIETPVVPSLLRNFSAPVKLTHNLTDADLAFLIANDSDEFNRWNSSQQLAVNVMLSLIEHYQQGKALQLDDGFVSAFKAVLTDPVLDKALAARVLSLPSEDYLAELMPVVDVDAIHFVYTFCRYQIARQLENELLQVFNDNYSNEFDLSAKAVGQRSLKNLCLSYLVELNKDDTRQLAMTQYQSASNMTDQITALRALAHIDCAERIQVLADFYQQWKEDPLVIDKWFIVQATASLADALVHIDELQQHEAFDIKVPNRVRSLIGAFSQGNPVIFHDKSGEGYRLLADIVIKLNQLNPQIAARLLLPLIQWKRYDEQRQDLMKQQLNRIAAMPDIARDVYEIVSKGLSQ